VSAALKDKVDTDATRIEILEHLVAGLQERLEAHRPVLAGLINLVDWIGIDVEGLGNGSINGDRSRE
jgi:hypothetical protein